MNFYVIPTKMSGTIWYC